MILKTISEQIEDSSIIHLFFITRKLKDNTKKTDRVLDKFDFTAYQVDVNDEIRKYLRELTEKHLSKMVKSDYDMEDYDVLTDDSHKVLTYQMENKKMSFANVVTEQLLNKPSKIKDVVDLVAKGEEIWAYSVGFYSKKETNQWIYTFRKVPSGKVAVDAKSNPETSKMDKTIRTVFNTQTQKLELLKGQTINLDTTVDCIYFNDTFYIKNKRQFEQIIGLEEEFKEEARQVVTKLQELDVIEGLDLISEQIEDHPPIHKKLVRISKIGNYRDINRATLNKMKAVSKAYGSNLKVKNNKLVIEDKNDIELVLKMLSDYYKRGEVSGKPYGTYAGKQIEQS